MCNRRETKNPPGGFILDASFVSPETFAFRLGRFRTQKLCIRQQRKCIAVPQINMNAVVGLMKGFLNVHIIKESDEHKYSSVLIDRQSRSTRAYTVLFDAADVLYNAE